MFNGERGDVLASPSDHSLPHQQGRRGVEGQQQLRHFRAVCQPAAVRLHPGDHLGRFAVDRRHPGPGQHRAAALRRRERLPVGPDFLLVQRVEHPTLEGRLDEDVLLQHEFLADAGRTERLRAGPGGRRQFLGGQRLEEGLQQHDPGDPVRVPGRPVEGQGTAPVVADEDDPVEAQRLEPGVQVAGLVVEAVVDVRLAGGAHADQVRREHPGPAGQVRDDVAPEVGGGGVAVQEHHGRAARVGPGVQVGEMGVDHGDGGHRDGSSRRTRGAAGRSITPAESVSRTNGMTSMTLHR